MRALRNEKRDEGGEVRWKCLIEKCCSGIGLIGVGRVKGVHKKKERAEDLSLLCGGELIRSVNKAGEQLFANLNTRVHIVNVDFLFKGNQCI